MPETILRVPELDSAPLGFALTEADRSPVDLTNCTAVFDVVASDGTKLLDGGAMTITTPVKGLLQYLPEPAGLFTPPGRYRSSITVTDGAGLTRTYGPFALYVLDTARV